MFSFPSLPTTWVSALTTAIAFASLRNRVFPFKPNGVQMTPVVTAYTPFVMFCCKQLANDHRLNAIMNRQMADEEAAASSLAGRLSSAIMMVS
jgi:hypothetical protein